MLIRSIFAREKLHERFSASAVFPAQNRTNWHSSKTCFALITHLFSTQTKKSWKVLMNNKFKAQSVNRKSYRKFTLPWFSVTCFNMSGYFDQSARSIESRCVVNAIAICDENFHINQQIVPSFWSSSELDREQTKTNRENNEKESCNICVLKLLRRTFTENGNMMSLTEYSIWQQYFIWTQIHLNLWWWSDVQFHDTINITRNAESKLYPESHGFWFDFVFIPRKHTLSARKLNNLYKYIYIYN